MKRQADTTWRLIFFTDPHVSFDSRPEHQRWYPGVMRLSPGPVRRWMLRRLDWRSQQNLRMVFGDADNADVVICGGDATPGEDERGMVSAVAQDQYRRFRQIVDEYWHGPFYSAWGNHDVGYHYFRQRIGGMSCESLDAATTHIGPPFQRIQLGEWSILIVCSELLAAARRRRDGNGELWDVVEELAGVQRAWIRSELAAAQRVVFVDHDPTKFLSDVWPEVIATGCEAKVHLTLAGHMHLRPLGQALRAASSAARAARLHVIPSTWQAWGIGCGYAQVALTAKGVRLSVRWLAPAKVNRALLTPWVARRLAADNRRPARARPPA